jgi:siroheme synthase
VALIAHGTRPEQNAVATTLAGVVGAARSARIASPAIIVVGEVAALADLPREHPLTAQAVSRIASGGVHT